MMIKYLFLTLLFCFSSLSAQDKAFERYQAGEKASNAEERKAAFNDALSLYLQMESESPSYQLLYNIANCYYQLHEYGLAILYYNKALKENPRFDAARGNLNIALQKVGLAKKSHGFIETYILFFHYKLSHNEKAVGLLFVLFIVFTLFSIHLWMPQGYLKQLAKIALWVAFTLSCSIIWSDYLTSREAICIRPVALRRDAGDQYAPVVGLPIIVGSTLKVLDVTDGGNWLKVQAPSGEEGYISKEYARII